MIYLSLFNGISAGRLAAVRAGLKFDKYYIAEIDKWANKVSDSHYPDNIQLGDVTQWREWNIDWSQVSLVTAGFPCQAWSMAGKQMGDKDPRGALFWTTLEIIGNVLKHNPDAKYMLENVKMKKEFEEYITHHTEQALGGVTKTLINSALVSAQNRNRYYWTNFQVDQPEDKGILLRQIIDEGYVDREKSYCIDANYFKGGNPDQYFNKSRRQLVFLDDRFSTYRKLTPTECARLQTFPDGWCESVVSNTQAYKCYGNAWTVDVIAHIFEEMKK
ncbi:C-5 cytosine-specific DNA methylase [Flyfo podovirus Tbat2_2]|nr:C-5 cytosine-specific DNA methylase [Flyfo podovirus Tbat2_2]